MAKGKKGKKTKEELEAEKEQKRLEREQILEEQKQFIEYEILRNEEKIKLAAKHHEVRMVQLHNTIHKFLALGDLMLDEELEARHLREWNLYLKEDRLPNPPIVPEMNTYLHRWHINDSTYEIENIPERTDEVLSLLRILDEFMDFPLEANERLIENWKEVHDNFCYELRYHFDVATYRILRFIEEKMTRKDLNEYSFGMEAENFNIYLWTMMPLPKPMIQPIMSSRECNFPNIGVFLTIPAYLTKLDLVVRGLYVNFDHFSSLSSTSKGLPLPEEMKQDLAEKSEEERIQTIRIQNEEVNFRLKKLNQLRSALIGLATEYNIEIPKYEAQKEAAKEKGKKKKKEGNEDPEALKALKKREENIQILMSELEIDNSNVLAAPVSGASVKDDESTSKKSQASKKAGGKKGGPEKDFWATVEKIKNIPLHKTASTILSEREEKEDADIRGTLCLDCESGVLNLRKYAIVGGVFQIDLIIILPQPYQHPETYLMSVINLPMNLEYITDEDLQPPFEEKKEERVSLGPRKSTLQKLSTMFKSLVEVRGSLVVKLDEDEYETDEEEDIDDEAKWKEERRKSRSRTRLSSRRVTMERSRNDLGRSSMDLTKDESKMFKLSSMIDFRIPELENTQYPVITVKMRDDVIYFEPPIIVQWDEEKSCWFRRNCFNVDIKDKDVTFQVNKFGPMAFATIRYSNLPFQSWDLRPCQDDKSVELRIRAKYVNVLFKIKKGDVSLESIEKVPKHIFADIIGKYIKARDLVKYMRKKGVDIFPDEDTYCYIPEVQPKYKILEEHLYHCMAILSGVYNFCWSRWNKQQDRRKIVILMREFLDRWYPDEPGTLLVTPLRVGFLDLTEWSPEFKEEYVPGIKFFADLNSYAKDQMTLSIQKKVKACPTSQVETVFEMLCRTKVISYTTTYPERKKEPFVSYQVQPPVEEKKKKKGKKGKNKK